jgi:general secretion pathway protein G
MTRSHSSRRRRGGFTLIEVLMVLAILVIIAGLAATNIFGLFAKSKIDAAKTEVKGIEMAAKAFYLEMGDYPGSLEALLQPMQTRDGRMLGGAWLEKAPYDPWGHPYQYAYPSQNGQAKPDIWATGPDGQPIGNWQF